MTYKPLLVGGNYSDYIYIYTLWFAYYTYVTLINKDYYIYSGAHDWLK